MNSRAATETATSASASAPATATANDPRTSATPLPAVDLVCPACGAATLQVKCKVVCPRCHLIVLNCSEF
jgi:hypothetical protein